MGKIFLKDPGSGDVKAGPLLEVWQNKVRSCPPGTCPLTVQLSMLEASIAQTCGKCVPCRDGLPQLRTLLRRVLEGGATMESLDEMETLAAQIRDTAD